MASIIGQTVSHYKILDHLGGGGMGLVYRARDTKLDRFVALKFLPPELTRDPGAKTRFIHEAKMASSLQHNNICTVHDIDQTEDGQIFIVMDCYDGRTLEERLEQGPLTVPETLEIVIQIAQGLQKAHGAGIIHRDIKPANIMLTADGVLKILDFGVAKLTDQTSYTRAGSTLGTVAYMSPEQAGSGSVDQRTDLWALGVVMYESLTGVRPFQSAYEQAVIYSILHDDPRSARQVRPEIPPELERILLRCLEKKPEERYQQVSELLAALLAVQHTLNHTDRRTSAPGRAKRLRRFGLVGAFLLVVLAGLLLIILPARAVPFTERDWIVISDFENTTGDARFDRSLRTAFGISIEQSNYVNIIPRRRMDDALRRMKRDLGERITEPIAREIALREGIGLVVVPGISRIGDTFALTWKIEEATDGETLRSGITQAHGEAQILPSLDQITRTIRETLGESSLSLSRRAKSLSQVTTKSFEALREYSYGIEDHLKFKIDQARLHYAAALALDSNFTSAQASLGMLDYENSDTTEGKKLLTQALKGIDGLTDRERYGILAFHARAVEGDFQKAIRYWKLLLEHYPDYSPAHNNLGYLYYQCGQYTEATTEYREALRCDPTLQLTAYGLVWLYLYSTGYPDSALLWSQRQIALDSTQAFAYDNLGYAAVGLDSLKVALHAFRKLVELKPTYPVGLFRLSDTYRMLGRYREAIPPLEKLLSLDHSEHWAKYQLGILYEILGETTKAHRYYTDFVNDMKREIRKKPREGKSYLALAAGLTRLGSASRGWETGKRGITLDSSAHFEFAQLLAIRGEREEAVHQLELAVQNGFRNYIWIKIHPDFWSLRDDLSLQKLLQGVLHRPSALRRS